MNQDNRYLRQTQLSNFGPEGQAKLASAKVLVVGLGGLGIPVVHYLNAMGVGVLGLVEQDRVELHNLQRQVLYSEKDVGKPKLEVVLKKLQDQNSTTRFQPYDTYLTRDNALGIIHDFDLVVDATDNFSTRYLINDACIIHNKPFVYGALHGFEGQVSVFNYQDGPTYRCLFPKQPDQEEIPNCDENGVLGVLPGIVGTLQALETVKVLTGVGEVLSGNLLLFDGLTQTSRKIQFKARPEHKNIQKLQDSYGMSICAHLESIAAEQFISLWEKEKLQLIDVRSTKEFEAHHIENSINIPLPELEERLHQINSKEPIYLICQSGKRSQMAYEKLQKHFPTASLFNVTGGMAKLNSYGVTE